ncbi:MAG: patatin-like phospholipase family protein [Caulobacteraceae bacterium]
MRARTIAAVVSLFGLCACGTVPRDVTVGAGLLPLDDYRIHSADESEARSLTAEVAQRLPASRTGPVILAISGGSNAAYSAGVLTGWSEAGTRPEFAIVTGTSSGALLAPLAFLGSSTDALLRRTVTGPAPKRLLKVSLVSAMTRPALFSPAALRTIITEVITPEVVRAIAAEHAKGRRLFVVTTDLDAEESVIWDMGAIAARGDAQGLRLFRDVLLASASVPGVYPPVMLQGVRREGCAVSEMHTDGGVTTAYMVVPESLRLWRPAGENAGGGSIYLLVSGKSERETWATGGDIVHVLIRAYDTSAKTNLRTQLTITSAFAAQNGMKLYISAVPEGVKSGNLSFKPKIMSPLFELGRSRAAAGHAWAEAPPPEGAALLARNRRQPPAPSAACSR